MTPTEIVAGITLLLSTAYIVFRMLDELDDEED